MKKVYNKLVRDKIPEIIENNGGVPTIRVLDDEEYKESLIKKLKEEYEEALSVKNDAELIEELADMLEIIYSLSSFLGINDVTETMKIKRKKRGGFDKRIFLVSVDEDV